VTELSRKTRSQLVLSRAAGNSPKTTGDPCKVLEDPRDPTSPIAPAALGEQILQREIESFPLSQR